MSPADCFVSPIGMVAMNPKPWWDIISALGPWALGGGVVGLGVGAVLSGNEAGMYGMGVVFAFLGLLVHEFVKDGEEKQKRQLGAYTQANWQRFEAKRAAESESGVTPQVPSDQPTPKRPTGS